MLFSSLRRRAAVTVAGAAVTVLFPLTSAVVGADVASAAPARTSTAPTTASAAPLSAAARAKARQKARAQKIVKVAARYKGRPYRYGASGPSAFDCSGYTSYVIRKAIGRSLPHNSAAQSRTVKRVKKSNRRVGDLVFFGGRGSVHHVGIYAGKGDIWHSPRAGKRVHRADIYSRNVFYGRVA